MGDASKILLPHGGYHQLIVYQKSVVVYQGTVLFCKRFLPARGDRTVDQMVQAARSCKQNIVEGSTASGTSKETELKLTNVARASLDELIEDYQDWLMVHHLTKWEKENPKMIAARKFSKETSDWERWRVYFETRDTETCANLMLVLCYQTRYLLTRMISRLEADFVQQGDVCNRMRGVRSFVRSSNWEQMLYAQLSKAVDLDDLNLEVGKCLQKIKKMSSSIAFKKGWTNPKKR